jgi:hypothetical protein
MNIIILIQFILTKWRETRIFKDMMNKYVEMLSILKFCDYFLNK